MPQAQNTETARFMAALDEQQPRWHIALADQQDLSQVLDGSLSVSGLRARVANRLLIAVRAALSAGIVDLPAPTVFEARPEDDFRRGTPGHPDNDMGM